MKKIIAFFAIYAIIYVLAHFINHLLSTGDAPQITDFNEREWRGGYLSSNPYTFYTYYLHDDTRKCHLGSSETFYIMKKEFSISPDDCCEHCNMKWSLHFKK